MDYFDHATRIRFPPPDEANPWGVVAQGGNLSPGVLLSAYEQGIFPWYESPPILWFSPDPRFVLRLDRFRIASRLRRTIRKGRFNVTFDRAFGEVIHACRATRLSDDTGTWITTDMEEAYCELHRLGHAHSVEVWDGTQLSGGLYGVAVGTLFAGESMFSLLRDASKFALVALVGLLDAWGLELLDCQSHTDYLASFGAENIPRPRFLRTLARLRNERTLPANWSGWDAQAMVGRALALEAANRGDQ
ncbi:MAG: leucyl/phenylalanyl-tRNA--protein transferase [Spirochaetales bacterium]|nr:leucyl/phenylalanyl-tRNA--protein transferase [Spirochaetales bacterium]